MFSVERRYRISLQPTGGGGSSYTQLWVCEDAVQQLAVTIYSPAQIALPAGSAQLTFAGGSVGSPVSFAGNSLFLPMYPLVVDTSDSELGYIHPSTANPKPYDDELSWNGSAWVSAASSPGPRTKVLPIASGVTVTNGGSKPFDLIIHFTALNWRNA